MRSFPALMLMVLIEYLAFSLILRPIMEGVQGILEAAAMMMNTSIFR
ncbi:hypothetical protein [Thermoflexus sp.]|nr:hypothetical protein [Thermoflexus sp.]